MLHRLSVGKMVAFVGLLGASAVLVGCEGGPKVEEERQQLYSQNREAQTELDRTRQALEALTNERNQLGSENARLSAELDSTRSTLSRTDADLAAARASLAQAKQPVPQSAPEPVKSSGFSEIAGVETVAGPGVITVRVPGDVLFEPGKIDVKPGARKTLDQVVAVIQKEYPGKTVRVEGYTDTDPISKSKWTDNLELSLQRSAAVTRYLQSKGIAGNRMYAAGFGEYRPRSSKAHSRRVEIVVLLNDSAASGK